VPRFWKIYFHDEFRSGLEVPPFTFWWGIASDTYRTHVLHEEVHKDDGQRQRSAIAFVTFY
jgi:hypothetical protein